MDQGYGAPTDDGQTESSSPLTRILEEISHRKTMRPHVKSLASKELVRNLPKLKFDQHFCDACKVGKQAHASHKAKNLVSTTRCLELLHMDLFGPSAVRSYGGNRYTLVIVDDYSRYTWTRFLKDKTEAFDQFEIFSKKIQNQLGCTIVSIRTDHGREFDNEVQFGEFCNANGITHNFSAPRTPIRIPNIKCVVKGKIVLTLRTMFNLSMEEEKDEECESVDSTKYRGMIGSLLYLTASRPDIMFSVCLCARFQEAPKTSHLEAVKRIFRYIKGTTHLGLWYPKGTDIETVVYADSDHAGDYVDRKSTSGICTFVGCCLTSWFSKKQTALAISTTEAEYVSAGKACQQALWMKQALIDYDVRLDDVPIMCDNKGAIDLSKNPVQHSRTKHIEIRHHFLRDNVQKGHISIEKVPSVDNIADILTKPLKRESFNYLREMNLEDELRYTKSYIPTISDKNYIPENLKPTIQNLEYRSIHEGRPLSPESTKYDNIQNLFQTIKLGKIYELYEGICPRFLLEFYSSIEIIKDENQNIFLTFWALKRTFKFSLKSFASILSIPCKGECSYSEESSLDTLKSNQESNTPYQTHIATPKEIIQSITTTGQTIFPNKILKEELRQDLRSWNEIIQDNAFGTLNESPFLTASSCHMMYCILTSTPFNFAYFLTKRVEKIKNQPNSPMPY
ncbi:copia protein [Tanacetum coccineum]